MLVSLWSPEQDSSATLRAQLGHMSGALSVLNAAIAIEAQADLLAARTAIARALVGVQTELTRRDQLN